MPQIILHHRARQVFERLLVIDTYARLLLLLHMTIFPMILSIIRDRSACLRPVELLLSSEPILDGDLFEKAHEKVVIWYFLK
jgi:hypothetical protein